VSPHAVELYRMLRTAKGERYDDLLMELHRTLTLKPWDSFIDTVHRQAIPPTSEPLARASHLKVLALRRELDRLTKPPRRPRTGEPTQPEFQGIAPPPTG
jgi:hypothetical protein